VKKVKVILFGLGAIGKRHAKMLKRHFRRDLYAFHSGKSNRNQNGIGIRQRYNWQEEDQWKPDIAFITNPTSMRMETVITCIKRGMVLFIEKPLGSNVRNLKSYVSNID